MNMLLKSIIRSPNEPVPAWYEPITEEMLEEITQRIVRAFQPEKIVLFGSYAYGQPAFKSDLDLLVVMKRYHNRSVFERDRLVTSVARPRGIAMDVLVRTPKEVAYRLKIGDRFFHEVMTKGQVLYERSQHRRRVVQKTERQKNGGQKYFSFAASTARANRNQTGGIIFG
jgi:predicted nucleotidyltransferase